MGPQKPAPEPPVNKEDDAEYPFALLPFESVKLADGRGANRPWLQALPDPCTSAHGE